MSEGDLTLPHPSSDVTRALDLVVLLFPHDVPHRQLHSKTVTSDLCAALMTRPVLNYQHDY